MEKYWMTVSVTYIVLYIFIMGMVLCLFSKAFVKNKMAAFLAGITYTITMVILYFIPFRLDNFAAYGLGVMAAFVVMCLADRQNFTQKIFVVMIFYSFRWLSVYIVDKPANYIYNKIIGSLYMTEHEILQFSLYAFMNIFELLMIMAVIGVGCKYIIDSFKYKYETMTLREMMILIIPSVMGMTGYGMMQQHNELAVFHYIMSAATIVMVIVLFENAKNVRDENMQLELINNQTGEMKKHIVQIENLYGEIRSMKHDMVNHVMTLQALYEKNEMQRSQEYLFKLKKNVNDATGKLRSGNPVTDIILDEYKSRADALNIRFENSFFYPEKLSDTSPEPDVYDISVILCNALDNAFEAIEKYYIQDKDVFISIKTYRNNNAYMVEISNSFRGETEIDTDGGLPVTTKSEKTGHGYGLLNIRRMARKYHGDIDICNGDGVFKLTVMLMLP